MKMMLDKVHIDQQVTASASQCICEPDIKIDKEKVASSGGKPDQQSIGIHIENLIAFCVARDVSMMVKRTVSMDGWNSTMWRPSIGGLMRPQTSTTTTTTGSWY